MLGVVSYVTYSGAHHAGSEGGGHLICYRYLPDVISYTTGKERKFLNYFAKVEQFQFLATGVLLLSRPSGWSATTSYGASLSIW